MNKYEKLIDSYKQNKQREENYQEQQKQIACQELTRKLQYLLDNPSIDEYGRIENINKKNNSRELMDTYKYYTNCSEYKNLVEKTNKNKNLFVTHSNFSRPVTHYETKFETNINFEYIHIKFY